MTKSIFGSTEETPNFKKGELLLGSFRELCAKYIQVLNIKISVFDAYELHEPSARLTFLGFRECSIEPKIDLVITMEF